MYAQCPECLSIYRLRVDQLAQARGRARCGSCGSEFDLLASLAEDLPQAPGTTLKRRPANAPLPLLNSPAARPASEQRELFVGPEPVARPDPPPPSFAKLSAAPAAVLPAPRAAGWWFGTAVLLVLLLAQYGWLERERLLAEPRVAALARATCATLGCTLPLVADRRAIALTARDVRPHPSSPGALIITATIANTSGLTQSFPVVEITLSDLEERRIAMRRFQPREYVGDRGALARGLPAGASATLSLEVEDPGREALAFEFRFL